MPLREWASSSTLRPPPPAAHGPWSANLLTLTLALTLTLTLILTLTLTLTLTLALALSLTRPLTRHARLRVGSPCELQHEGGWWEPQS